MVYLIIGVILLLVIAPIFAVLPSGRQKERMALRKLAMSKGFTVALTRIEDPDPDPGKYLTNTGKPIDRVMDAVAYRAVRRRPSNWRQLPRTDWSVVRRRDATSADLPPGWAFEGDASLQISNDFKGFLSTHLANLPADVLKVDEENFYVSVYWNEHGGADAVNDIIGFLNACREIQPYEMVAGESRS